MIGPDAHTDRTLGMSRVESPRPELNPQPHLAVRTQALARISLRRQVFRGRASVTSVLPSSSVMWDPPSQCQRGTSDTTVPLVSIVSWAFAVNGAFRAQPYDQQIRLSKEVVPAHSAKITDARRVRPFHR